MEIKIRLPGWIGIGKDLNMKSKSNFQNLGYLVIFIFCNFCEKLWSSFKIEVQTMSDILDGKLTWLVLGEDPAARSHRVEQFTALWGL